MEERYRLLQSNAEKRRVQEMLLGFIEEHNGRVVQLVPGSTTRCYIVSRRAALQICAAKLRDGPFPVDDDDDDDHLLDDGTIHTFPTDDLSVNHDFNINEIIF
jgi:hypothetical protein